MTKRLASPILILLWCTSCTRHGGGPRPPASAGTSAQETIQQRTPSTARAEPLLTDSIFDAWCAVSGEDCRSQVERARLGEAGARRKGLDLLIPTDSGATVVLHDSVVEDQTSVSYTYGGYSAALQAHLIRADGYEGHGWLLVNAHTGRKLYIVSPPIVSPDGTRFAAVYADLEAMFNPTEIDVWRVRGDTAELEFHLEPIGNTDIPHVGDWGPTSATWVTSDSLTLTTAVRTEQDGSPVAGMRVAVVRRNGQWLLIGRAR